MGKHQSKPNLTDEELNDLSQQTGFTSEEVKNIQDDFYLDYPDGKMTSRRLRQVYDDFFPGMNIFCLSFILFFLFIVYLFEEAL